ncbi:hypothetical protein KR074_004870 [Drosophila pseudoananassae]|nr:hypothetical protein KR074_004870 [Drosophila pseudoananassae]
MQRSILLLLISVTVLSVAVALPLTLDEYFNQNLEASLNMDLAEKSGIRKRNAQDSSGSHEDPQEKSSSNAEINPAFKSSSDSDSAEESPKSEEEVSPTRRRRSANEVRNKNLENLATICPTKKLEILEEGSFLDVKIEIRDMYKLCKDLPNRHH